MRLIHHQVQLIGHRQLKREISISNNWQRIELDLDDDVKVNYAMFQEIEVGGEGQKKQKINLLAKI